LTSRLQSFQTKMLPAEENSNRESDSLAKKLRPGNVHNAEHRGVADPGRGTARSQAGVPAQE